MTCGCTKIPTVFPSLKGCGCFSFHFPISRNKSCWQIYKLGPWKMAERAQPLFPVAQCCACSRGPYQLPPEKMQDPRGRMETNWGAEQMAGSICSLSFFSHENLPCILQKLPMTKQMPISMSYWISLPVRKVILSTGILGICIHNTLISIKQRNVATPPNSQLQGKKKKRPVLSSFSESTHLPKCSRLFPLWHTWILSWARIG